MRQKEKYQFEPNEVRIYSIDNSCVFKKNTDKYGGLSNMATGFPLQINNVKIKTVEALYQACRFPHLPEIQQRIINQSSPMNVKMISNANKKNSREDWDQVRIKIMKWCIQVKLAQHFNSFGSVLNETGLKNIVENSSTDNFWGAIPDIQGKTFVGKNALGRLLMDLRQTFYSTNKFSLLIIEPIIIPDFLLFNEKITVIDERQNFVNSLEKIWNDKNNRGFQGELFSDI
jgi:ribA/ribD-fused uncharacterized protein